MRPRREFNIVLLSVAVVWSHLAPICLGQCLPGTYGPPACAGVCDVQFVPTFDYCPNHGNLCYSEIGCSCASVLLPDKTGYNCDQPCVCGVQYTAYVACGINGECLCTADYWGPNCQYTCTKHKGNKCNSKGTCVNEFTAGQQGICQCQHGYRGNACQTTNTMSLTPSTTATVSVSVRPSVSQSRTRTPLPTPPPAPLPAAPAPATTSGASLSSTTALSTTTAQQPSALPSTTTAAVATTLTALPPTAQPASRSIAVVWKLHDAGALSTCSGMLLLSCGPADAATAAAETESAVEAACLAASGNATASTQTAQQLVFMTSAAAVAGSATSTSNESAENRFVRGLQLPTNWIHRLDVDFLFSDDASKMDTAGDLVTIEELLSQIRQSPGPTAADSSQWLYPALYVARAGESNELVPVIDGGVSAIDFFTNIATSLPRNNSGTTTAAAAPSPANPTTQSPPSSSSSTPAVSVAQLPPSSQTLVFIGTTLNFTRRGDASLSDTTAPAASTSAAPAALPTLLPAFDWRRPLSFVLPPAPTMALATVTLPTSQTTRPLAMARSMVWSSLFNAATPPTAKGRFVAAFSVSLGGSWWTREVIVNGADATPASPTDNAASLSSSSSSPLGVLGIIVNGTIRDRSGSSSPAAGLPSPSVRGAALRTDSYRLVGQLTPSSAPALASAAFPLQCAAEPPAVASASSRGGGVRPSASMDLVDAAIPAAIAGIDWLHWVIAGSTALSLAVTLATA